MKRQKKQKLKQKKNRQCKDIIQSKDGIHISSVFPLEILAEKRSGGAESIKGFVFQCQYAAWKLLEHLEPSDAPDEKFIRLEGVEDIDVFRVATDKTSNEFIQVKSSKNRMDAGKFWGEHRILQNFAEAYIKAPENRFRLVHDMPFSKGFLSRLNQSLANGEPLSKKDLKHWQDKFSNFRRKQQDSSDKKDVWDWNSFHLTEFLNRICFEKNSSADLSGKICRLLINNYNIAEGNEGQYMRALFWSVFLWSRDRAVVRHGDVLKIIEAVRDDIDKGAVNPVTSKRWMEHVVFNPPEKGSRYFEGRPARPHDIAAGLPAQRSGWEQKILDTFRESDVTVIRASSGQGKSTLAWIAAFQLSQNGWSPYELRWCADSGEIGNFLTFIESRIKIGETPLIVIDGLSQQVAEWGELAWRTMDLPVKFIVTAREEDWYRFGADRSRLRLIPVSIEMDREEARDIFCQFQKAGKLKSGDLTWQTAWERVQKRGLLIEYVYLLTQGTMMEERLSHQIRTIADEKDRREKLEILRLISVADLCDVRLLSLALIESVEKRVGFRSDRGETLKSLVREYQILIEDRMYAEGLHPVRSRHLADILHETLPLSETLIKLLSVIEPDSLHEFCSHAPLMVDGMQRILFLKKLAEYVSKMTYADMIQVINGLFSTEVKQNWKINRQTYDDMFAQGKLNELFVLSAFPWNENNTLRIAEKIDKFKNAAQAQLDIINHMTLFDPEQSDTHAFLRFLSKHLAKKEATSELRGLGRLIKWYSKFDLKCPLLRIVDETILWRAINTLDLSDAAELFDAYNSEYPEGYRIFRERNEMKVVGLLKRLTNTMTIKEVGENLLIEYLTYDHGKKRNLNAESVNRAQNFSSFFPHLNEYHVNGIYPPIPGLDIWTSIIDESKKRLSRKGIGNKFRSYVNRIWIDNIMVNYESASVYEWQKQWYDIRIKSLDFADVCIRFIEAILEGKKQKGSRIANELDGIRPVVLSLLVRIKEFPRKGIELSNADELKDMFEAFFRWSFAWRNFLQQLLWLLNKDDREKNVVNVNIQDARRKLGNMQNSFNNVMERTFPYFNVEKLVEKETAVYNRLARTVDFYLLNTSHVGKVFNAKIAAANLWSKQERSRIYKVRKIISEFEENSNFEFIPPSRTIDNGGHLEAAIGVKGLSFRQLQSENFFVAISGLLGLADVDILFYYFVAIQEDCTENNKAIRVSNSFFQKVKDIMASDEQTVDFGIDVPYPVSIQKEILDTLPGIIIKQEAEESIVTVSLRNILIQLWRLAEISTRLSLEEKTEVSWRLKLERECKQIMNENMKIIEEEAPEDIIFRYRTLTEDVVMNNQMFTSDDFQRFFMEDIKGNI